MTPRRADTRDLAAIAALTDAAYRPNEAVIGVASLPRLADHAEVLAEQEIWVVDGEQELAAVLVLDPRPDDFVLWSIAVSPTAAGQGLGARLMRFTEERATELGHGSVHLYTHAKLTDRIAWYERLGYVVTHYEDLTDRRLVHLRKTIAG